VKLFRNRQRRIKILQGDFDANTSPAFGGGENKNITVLKFTAVKKEEYLI
jgi:hypothetical protein